MMREKNKGMKEERPEGSFFIGQLKFGPDGLIPAIIQDVHSGEVLMMAYMNREALELTWETGETWFYSRSRRQLWHKGETSGHVQRVRGISFDCDRDTLLVSVEQIGAACHEGYRSCFHREVETSGKIRLVGSRVFDPEKVYGENVDSAKVSVAAGSEKMGSTAESHQHGPVQALSQESNFYDIISQLYRVILDRREKRPEGSYTTYLFNQGLDKICKKIGEEASEIIIAAKNKNREELIYEAADFVYHLLVLLAAAEVTPEEVAGELGRRLNPRK